MDGICVSAMIGWRGQVRAGRWKSCVDFTFLCRDDVVLVKTGRGGPVEESGVGDWLDELRAAREVGHVLSGEPPRPRSKSDPQETPCLGTVHLAGYDSRSKVPGH